MYIGIYRLFGTIYYTSLQGSSSPVFLICLTPYYGDDRSSRNVDLYQYTQRNFPIGRLFHKYTIVKPELNGNKEHIGGPILEMVMGPEQALAETCSNKSDVISHVSRIGEGLRNLLLSWLSSYIR